MFCRHYPSVESEHYEEGQGATAEDSGTKESEDERGTDYKRQRSGSKDKKGVSEKGGETERKIIKKERGEGRGSGRELSKTREK